MKKLLFQKKLILFHPPFSSLMVDLTQFSPLIIGTQTHNYFMTAVPMYYLL